MDQKLVCSKISLGQQGKYKNMWLGFHRDTIICGSCHRGGILSIQGSRDLISVQKNKDSNYAFLWVCQWCHLCPLKPFSKRVKRICARTLACWVASVVSDSLWPCRLYPTSLLCPWDSPGKNTGVGCHDLFQGIFPTQQIKRV